MVPDWSGSHLNFRLAIRQGPSIGTPPVCQATRGTTAKYRVVRAHSVLVVAGKMISTVSTVGTNFSFYESCPEDSSIEYINRLYMIRRAEIGACLQMTGLCEPYLTGDDTLSARRPSLGVARGSNHAKATAIETNQDIEHHEAMVSMLLTKTIGNRGFSEEEGRIHCNPP